MEQARIEIDPLNRHEQLVRWIESWCGGVLFTLRPLPSGASGRHFFRLAFDDNRPTLIVRDAPAHGDSDRFIRIARLLADAGLHAPELVAQDSERGLLVMTDLGDANYL